MLDVDTQVKELIDRAAKIPDGGEAMRYAQAALNAAHAAQVMLSITLSITHAKSESEQVGQP